MTSIQLNKIKALHYPELNLRPTATWSNFKSICILKLEYLSKIYCDNAITETFNYSASN